MYIITIAYRIQPAWSDLQSVRFADASNTVTDVGEAHPEVKKFMTKVNKTETKYECKINALTTQSTHIHNLPSVYPPAL